MSTPIQTLPPAPKPADIFIIGGGQKEVSEEDLQHVTFSIKVNAECKNDEREVTAVVPIYEHVLLQMMWARTGGEARITSDWLPSRAKYPRLVKLSRDNLRDEVTRLTATYKVHNPNGSVTNYFNEVYGRDGNPVKGFYEVINKQVRAWRALEAKIRDGHRLIAEDLLAISNLAKPEVSLDDVNRVDDFSDVTIEDGVAAPPVDGEIPADPLADLQDFLMGRDWSAEVVMDLCKVLGDGEKVNQVKVNELPSLHGKRSDQQRLMADYKLFLAEAEKKDAAKKNAQQARLAENALQPNP